MGRPPPLLFGGRQPPVFLRCPGWGANDPPDRFSTAKRHASNRARDATLSAGGCNPSFDSIPPPCAAGLGDCETGSLVTGEYLMAAKWGIQSPPWGVPKGRNACRRRRFSRAEMHGLCDGREAARKTGRDRGHLGKLRAGESSSVSL